MNWISDLYFGTGAAPGGHGPGPQVTVAPAVTGLAYPGVALATTDGTWTGSPSSYTYQWTKDGTNIAAATASTYAVLDADVGHSIRCVVTAVNGSGSTPAGSNAVMILTWSPLAFGTNLKGWWDSLNVTATAGVVDSITDKSGNGKHLIASGAERCTLVSGGGPDGVLDALGFAGASTMRVALTVAQPFTIAHVAKNSVGDKVVMGGEIGSFSSYTAAGSGEASYQAGNFIGGGIVNLDLWSIVDAVFDHAGGGSKLEVDGTVGTTSDPGSQSPTKIALGNYWDGTNQMTGRITEALIIAGVVSAANLTRLKHYLSARWTVDSL